MKWKWYEAKRLWRKYIKQEGSKRHLIDCVGPLWLFLHGAKVEYKVKLWESGEGWYAIDIAVPGRKLGVEADGWVHASRQNRDYIRDHRLGEIGWDILRINDDETKKAPKVVRRRVRKFLKG
jgi:very-short-patch-repair endonuclease